jgi:biotin-dependent carboxylase-like uncharacterized protein
MTQAKLEILQAGPQITLQDAGRFGLLRYGVPSSGPMDRFAFVVANMALGNPANGKAIEVSRGGLTLKCTQGCISFAVAGGDFQIYKDTELLSPWCISTLDDGESLSIQPGRWGSWCYLAFIGKIQSSEWLGSASTHALSGLGGGKITPGETIFVHNTECRPNLNARLICPVSARPRETVRVVLGPQDRYFDAGTIRDFLTQPFTLTDAYDRMGVRLAGPDLRPNAELTMPSEAILRGSIQVSGDGVATVLLADHQTTGGYPKIATILSDDLDGFAQLRSRDTVAFQSITADAAISAARTRNLGRLAFLAQFQRSN